MKCLNCQKEIISKRSTKKFCGNACKLAYHKKDLSVSKVVPVSVSKDTVNDTVTLSVSKPVTDKKLVFTTESVEERIKMYKDLYPNSGFVPNWVAHGFNSKEEAIKNAIKAVTKNQGIINMGLGND